MSKKKVFLFIASLFIFQQAFCQSICPVIPLPNHYEKADGAFIVNNHTAVIAQDPSFLPEASFLKNQLLRYTGIPLMSKEHNSSSIILKKVNTKDSKKGSYSIKMNAEKITIAATGRTGIFNGVISLLQLAIQSKETDHAVKIDCWDIKDAPLYEWRGVMLDESRHFFGKKIVKEILDQMALLKLNRFHWHLTDQPGWRIQIKKYPLLTLVGGIGNHSDSLAPAQYYTQDDIREIVAYATARHITVIPEIDMPGHATAANRAYPEFSGGGAGKFANFTFNPGKEATYHFLTNILREVSVLFPSGMIHLGGDEVSFGSKSWGSKPGVRALMQKEHMKNLKDVEHYFFNRMTDSALKIYNKVMAWDEVADASLPADSIVVFWWRHDKPEQLKKAFEKGYQVVLCPRIPLYFDFVQDSSDRDGRRWRGAFSSLEKVYQFSDNTYPAAARGKGSILGIQANLWTETVKSEKRLEYLLFPRITALAEAAWTEQDNRNYKQFLSRLKNQLMLYKKESIYYYNPFSPKATPEVID